MTTDTRKPPRFIIQDDASHYLEKLTPKQRQARYGLNGPWKTGSSLTKNEREAALAAIKPTKVTPKTNPARKS